MKGFGHAHLHAYRITATQVALGRFLKKIIQVHVSRGACLGTDTTADTEVFVDDNSPRIRIPHYCIRRAHFHAQSGLTLQTGAGKNLSPIHVHTNKYIWDPAHVSICLLKLTRLYAVKTGHTPFELHIYNVHSVRFHGSSPDQVGDGVYLFVRHFQLWQMDQTIRLRSSVPTAFSTACTGLPDRIRSTMFSISMDSCRSSSR